MTAAALRVRAQVERALLETELVEEAAVLGLPSEAFGQRVGAIVVPSARGAAAAAATSAAASGAASGARAAADEVDELERQLLEVLRGACGGRLAAYKLPTALRRVEAIPKNAMGKINKKALLALFEDREAKAA